ncbi:MAG TPA: cytochrome c [Burkholderiaceae bacterium]|nr:cytochrome c [Burkholderiaceae bacterium]
MTLAFLRAATLAVTAFSLSAAALGQDVNAGRRKANLCQPCHALDGRGLLPDAPHLSGQPAVYLERQLRAFRSGERRNDMMSLVAKYLNDDDVRDLAAYFASIKIEIKGP